MSTTLTLLGRRYEVAARRVDPGAGQGARFLRGAERVLLDERAARRFLWRAIARDAGMAGLRRLLGSRLAAGVVARLTDVDVIEQVARRIATSDLRVYAAPVHRLLPSLEGTDAVESSLGPTPEADAAPLSALPEERIDPALQAAALVAAARDGVPFCEECEKARQAAAAAKAKPAGPGDVADMDAAAQAQAMRDAAAEGVPFCEECWKAKRAQERVREQAHESVEGG